MKKLALSITLLLCFVGLQQAQAQSNAFPAKDLLNTLNSFSNSDLDVSSEQSSELKDLNSSIIEKASSIITGKESKEKKILDLKNLRKDSNSKLENILGDNTLKKYKKSMKKKLRPFKRKVGLVRLLL
ncbi:MAG: hypothetical protein ACK5MG_02220 [Bacteroidales bacterium]